MPTPIIIVKVNKRRRQIQLVDLFYVLVAFQWWASIVASIQSCILWILAQTPGEYLIVNSEIVKGGVGVIKGIIVLWLAPICRAEGAPAGRLMVTSCILMIGYWKSFAIGFIAADVDFAHPNQSPLAIFSSADKWPFNKTYNLPLTESCVTNLSNSRRGQKNLVKQVAVSTSTVTEAKGITTFRIFAASKVESYNINPSPLSWNSLYTCKFYTVSKSVSAPKGALYAMIRILRLWSSNSEEA